MCITEEVCTQMGLHLCQMVRKQKSCLIYYSCWSHGKWVFYGLVCNLLRIITAWYFTSQTRNDIEAFAKEASWQKMTIDDVISWVTWKVWILQTRTMSFSMKNFQFFTIYRLLCKIHSCTWPALILYLPNVNIGRDNLT